MNQQWADLPYETRLQLIRDKTPLAVLKGTYELTDDEIESIREVVDAVPKLKAGTKLESVNAAPDKRSLRESSRDFTMTLTFAELIDNAIDRFIKGKAKKGDVLKIDITFEREMNACVYQDNAGGIKKEDLPNLFRPGGTDNDTTGWSIGSYAWGAKKARSALSDSVDIISRAAKGPACFATIDRDWDNRDDDWKISVGEEGKNFELPPKFKIPVGSTRIIYKNLKPLVNTSHAALDDLRRDLGELYALLLEHHPCCPYQFGLEITIDGEPVTGDYRYRWTQYRDDAVDLHPRQAFYTANVTLPFIKDETKKVQQVEFILEIGVKQDTGAATVGVEESGLFDPTDDWGIDVYGLGVRLIERNLRAPLGLTHELVKKEQGAKLVKARLIVLGSSYAIPWDTHKANVAVAHPTLLAINEKIGPLVQEYVRVAQKAARKLQGAVSKFSDAPWDGEWVRKEAGAQVAFTYDKTEPPPPPPAPVAVDGVANGPPEKVRGKTKKEDKPQEPTPPPAPPPIRVAPTKLPAGAKQADYLPKIQFTKTNGSTVKQRSVKFQVTQDEYHRLAIWMKEEGAALNEKIKRYVLKQARSKTKKKKAGKSGAVDTKAFEAVRSKVNDPTVLALLLAAELNTPEVIRGAGKKGLLEAGLDAAKADMVLAAI